jgi:hypothetical protein
MKNFIKWLGIIALVAVIGFSLIGCLPVSEDGDDNGDDNNGGNNNGGGSITYPTITIKNNTGYYISYLYIKPSTSSDWGSSTYAWLSDGESKTVSLSQSLSANRVYDIRLNSTSGNGFNFIKTNVTVSNGMTVTFTLNDYEDGSSFPKITVYNRSGVSFNSVHVKPSVSSEWGASLGSISNNNDRTVTIPIPPSSYTVFDIQMRSSNPTNTYTRSNITVSDGMTFIFTSADRDNPSIELPVIVIQNSTGYSITYLYIKPATSSDWGSSSYIWLSDGESRTVTLPQSLYTNSVYDIRLYSSSGRGYNFIKTNVTVSEGMILTFTTSDWIQ